MWGVSCATCLWKSEDNFVEFTFTFPRASGQPVGLHKHLCPRSPLTGLDPTFLGSVYMILSMLENWTSNIASCSQYNASPLCESPMFTGTTAGSTHGAPRLSQMENSPYSLCIWTLAVGGSLDMKLLGGGSFLDEPHQWAGLWGSKSCPASCSLSKTCSCYHVMFFSSPQNLMTPSLNYFWS